MYDTIFPADSVEFCPHQGLQDIFVVGTYKLEEGVASEKSPSNYQQRHGQCLVFRMNEDESNFTKIQTFDLPAILDMKWCHRSPATLAIADSESNVTIYEWCGDEVMFQQVQSIPCTSSTANLCLSLDWSNRRDSRTSLGSLVISLSNGSLCLLRPDATSRALTVETTWHAHDYEPWIAAWNYWNNNVVFSGGDDLQLKGWDVRDVKNPIFSNKRFDAGITAIQSHPFVENLISVGSYDNFVRLFDTRKPLVPLCETHVGGGVWRVKWHPSPERKYDLLVACMHDGFKVVNFGQGNSDSGDALSVQEGNVVKRFDEHASLAYGVDWSFSSRHIEESTIASCSFYDHLLHIWRG